VGGVVSEVAITAMEAGWFGVQVAEGHVETSHRVRVPDDLPSRIGLADPNPAQLEGLVRESMEFLLEREPATSILAEFSLHDIARYFPEYYDELRRRVGG
jgi:hypothetical protein